MSTDISTTGVNEMTRFYARILRDLLQSQVIGQKSRILVLCGGKLDCDVFTSLGFKNVVISNLDTRMTGTEYAPFEWSFQDAENLTLKDAEVDLCVAHNGLHHCRSPHRALLEMYRVAKRAVLVCEPRDSLLTRAGVRMNFGQDYEVAAVFHNDCAYGGMQNTEIPNFVYRWTEREIEKTVNSFAPWAKHQFIYWYEMKIPWGRLRTLKNRLWFFTTLAAYPFLKLFSAICRKQTNSFAFAVIKPNLPQDLHPWLAMEDGRIRLNRPWLDSRYHR